VKRIFFGFIIIIFSLCLLYWIVNITRDSEIIYRGLLTVISYQLLSITIVSLLVYYSINKKNRRYQIHYFFYSIILSFILIIVIIIISQIDEYRVLRPISSSEISDSGATSYFSAIVDMLTEAPYIVWLYYFVSSILGVYLFSATLGFLTWNPRRWSSSSYAREGLLKAERDVSAELELRDLHDAAFQLELRTLPNNRLFEIIDCRYRAEKLLRKADLVTAMIVFVLAFAAGFIIFAGWIAEIGVTKTDPLAELVASRQRLEQNYEAAERRLAALREQYADLEGGIKKLDLSVKELQNIINNVSINSDLSEVEKEVEIDLVTKDLGSLLEERALMSARENRLKSEFEDVTAKLVRLNDRIVDVARQEAVIREKIVSAQALAAAESGRIETFADPRLLLATGLTRLGILIIAIFLVQILVKLYRYNTRQASYYLALSDSLLLMEYQPEEIECLHGVLWPNLDYGETPNTIPQRAANAFERAFGVIGRRGASKKTEEGSAG